MDLKAEHLVSLNAPPIVFVGSNTTAVERSLADLAEQRFRIVRISDVGTKTELMNRASEAFELPDYFGRNWDALEECLIDLANWMPANGYVVVLSADQFLETSPEDFRKTIDVMLGASSEYLRVDKIRFCVLLVGSRTVADWLFVNVKQGLYTVLDR